MDDNEVTRSVESEVAEQYPSLRPAPPMTRQEFVDKATDLLSDMIEDHEEHSGVSDSELHDWEYWSEQLSNAYLNS